MAYEKFTNEVVHLALGFVIGVTYKYTYENMTYTIKFVNFTLGALFQNNLGR